MLTACLGLTTRLSHRELKPKTELPVFEESLMEIRVRGEREVNAAVERMQDGLEGLCRTLMARKRESEMKEEHDDRELAAAIKSHKSMCEAGVGTCMHSLEDAAQAMSERAVLHCAVWRARACSERIYTPSGLPPGGR